VMGVAAAQLAHTYKPHSPAAVTYHAADPQLVTEAPFDPRWWRQLRIRFRFRFKNRWVRIPRFELARARLAGNRAPFDERKLDRYPPGSFTRLYTYAKAQITGFLTKPTTSTHFNPALTLLGTRLMRTSSLWRGCRRSDKPGVRRDLHDERSACGPDRTGEELF